MTTLAEGKTKIILQDPEDPAVVRIRSKDAITAGDGARRDVMPGKAEWSTATTAHVFSYLNACGVETAFIRPEDPVTFVARRCGMVPLEVVVRRLATGSYLKRNPATAEGHRFDPLLVEFFLKDDARHDPQVQPAEIVELLSHAEIESVVQAARRVFELLERAWAQRDVTLVDMKVEFGRHQGRLLLADVIDNDSWRLWPHGDKSQMKDKQVYRNLPEVTPQALEKIAENYAWVARETALFHAV